VNGIDIGELLGGRVASGLALGGNYYFVTNEGDFKVIENAGSGSGGVRTIKSGLISDGAEFGDIVWDGRMVIASYGPGSTSAGVLATFDLDGENFSSSSTGQAKYAGLAFSGGTLYGVRGEGSGSRLFSIDLGIGLGIAGAFVSAFITDLATVPLPAAAWLLLSGILGLVGLKRFKRREQASQPVAA
jgi:hypothetical protein